MGVDVTEVELGELVELDYRVGFGTEDEADGSLRPAWQLGDELDSVGYEPLGATSIGTELERKKHARWSFLRTPADRLDLLHEGRHSSDGTLSTRMAEQDKKRIVQSFCSALDLPRHQCRDAIRAILTLNLDEFGSTKRLENVSLAVIKVVVDHDRFVRLGNPDAKWISRTDAFAGLLEQFDLDRGDLMRLERRVKEKLQKVEFFERNFVAQAHRVERHYERSDEESSTGVRWRFQND